MSSSTHCRPLSIADLHPGDWIKYRDPRGEEYIVEVRGSYGSPLGGEAAAVTRMGYIALQWIVELRHRPLDVVTLTISPATAKRR
jgi:hypothetical protein